jgi:hypothetical protein
LPHVDDGFAGDPMKLRRDATYVEDRGPSSAPKRRRRNPWIWISAILTLALVGDTGELSTQSDLDAAEQQVKYLQAQIDAGKQTGSDAAATYRLPIRISSRSWGPRSRTWPPRSRSSRTRSRPPSRQNRTPLRPRSRPIRRRRSRRGQRAGGPGQSASAGRRVQHHRDQGLHERIPDGGPCSDGER